jgi:hypothetical protein
MYDRGDFPVIDGNPAVDVIWNCWNERVSAADEVVDHLNRLVSPIQDAGSRAEEGRTSHEIGGYP